MTVKELRYLVDNLDEYIRVPGGIERLKKTVLHLAVSGQLVPQDPAEGTGEELFQQIQAEKAKLIAAGKLKKQKPLPAITEAEIPFAIPKTWKWVRLGELTNYGSSEKAKPTSISVNTWVLELEDIEKGSSKLLAKVYGETRRSSSDKNIFYNGDVLYGKLRPYLDKVIVAHEGGVCSSEILPLRAPGKSFSPEFLRLSLKAPNFIDTINELTYGVKMPRLGTDDGRKMLIGVPPIAEQKRIVIKVHAIFALIDELAEKYRAEQVEREKLVASSLAQLARGNSGLALTHLSEIIRTKADAAQLRKTILHLAVSGQLVPQDPAEGTGKELFQQIQAEKAKLTAEGKLKKQKPLPEITEAEVPFAIPKTWKWVRLGEASTYQQRGKSPKYAVKSKFPVISQKCVRTNHIDWSAIKYITENSIDKYEDFRILQSGDLLLNSTGTGTMGRVGIFSTNSDYDKVVADSHVTVIRFSGQVDPGFAHACFNAPYIQDDVESKASGSTNQIEWNLLSIQNELLPLPPLAEQTRIVQKTTQLLDLIAKLEPHLEKYR